MSLEAPAVDPTTLPQKRRRRAIIVLLCSATLIAGGLIPTTEEDFHLPGTQIGDMTEDMMLQSDNCMGCHGLTLNTADPYTTWSGSLMAHAGRDPLFEAQMVTANQDVTYAGYYCMRCHVPMSIPTGHALPPDGSERDPFDSDGVSCHFCHAMVDPQYVKGESPSEDAAVLAALAEVPEYYGNAAFVLDPNGTRRGPRVTPLAAHATIQSDFFKSGDMCGTCHDVGNLCITRDADGVYRYNAIGEPTPNHDPWTQFPLERTYTEWKLSAFNQGGVDMGGRFGGVGGGVVSSCQDCHMPRAVGQACVWGPEYPDLARHDFAGASAWVLQIIAMAYPNDPSVNQKSLLAGQAAAVDMLQRAASLSAAQECGHYTVRVTNESGHKIPTGHIEGRRIWLNVKFYSGKKTLAREYGHYDMAQAHLDEETTVVYEMHVGLSPDASALTGYPAGETTHMALADVIVKDNRIPPRGFDNETYAAAGAPAIAGVYADGQHWSDVSFAIPDGVNRVEVTLNYQTVTRHYIEALRDGNHTNTKGQELYDLWEQSGKCAPISMATLSSAISGFVFGDLDCDGVVGGTDLAVMLNAWGAHNHAADLSGDGVVDAADLAMMLSAWE